MKQLIKKLDKVFSIYVRKRDSDENGICICCTCGRRKRWQDMDCGHHIKRQFMSTRYNEINCNAQCKYCNCFEQGNDAKYKEFIVKKYGENEYNKFELTELIKYYAKEM